MKTIACFVVTWITATALLMWLTSPGATHLTLGNAEITFREPSPFWPRFWHNLWIAGGYSLVNTFIVRFWQLLVEMRKKEPSGT